MPVKNIKSVTDSCEMMNLKSSWSQSTLAQDRMLTASNVTLGVSFICVLAMSLHVRTRTTRHGPSFSTDNSS